MADLPKVFVRSPYNYDTKVVSDQTGLRCEDVSLAVQSERDEVDINTIVRRFGLTGRLPEDVRLPQYGDFTGVSDYQSALNAVIAADKAFMELPAEVRSEFGNDPQALVEACGDPEQRDRLKALGLLKPEVKPADPIAVRVVADPVVVAAK